MLASTPLISPQILILLSATTVEPTATTVMPTSTATNALLAMLTTGELANKVALREPTTNLSNIPLFTMTLPLLMLPYQQLLIILQVLLVLPVIPMLHRQVWEPLRPLTITPTTPMSASTAPWDALTVRITQPALNAWNPSE